METNTEQQTDRRNPVLVTGGTGTLGRLVVRRLHDAGRDVRVLSREAREPEHGIEFLIGDLDTGDGIDAAVEGAGTVIHCAGAQKGDGKKATTLVAAAARAGVGHLVHISVVGADKVPVTSAIDRAMFGYFESKRAAEEAVAGSDVPWTTLRATQFHDLMATTVRGMAKLPVIPVPSGVRFQPVDAGDVAARLVELALAEPAGLVPDIAGPRVYPMAELVRSYLRAAGKHRLLVPLRLPGKAALAFREGANLSPDRAVGRLSWEDFLAERLGPATPAPAPPGASGSRRPGPAGR